LNDRGADLTTADLLKNFLFSQAGPHVRYIEENWIALEASFDKPDDLVRFIRYEYASRHGAVSTRKLYRAIQEDLATSGSSAKKYVERLSKAKQVYLALRDPDSAYWQDVEVEVRDALLAYRRFQFESSLPVLLAAFLSWKKRDAAHLLVKMAKWSVRALFAGNIGARLSEDVFGEAAVAISAGEARNQPAVRQKLARLIPTDAAFKAQFIAYGSVPTARAKYLLAMLERAQSHKQSKTAQPFDWASQGVNIEHVLSQAAAKTSDQAAALVDTIGNLALLEKRLNRDLADKPFEAKRAIYAESAFALTQAVGGLEAWDESAITTRTKQLAELACVAWPYR
ncbi:MAG TPA: HNH endonuclease family protein, partial [Coriobacteriia bacterium]|nr:HNH endonuclease family protein [Coriobacteriia bacterium]